MSQDSTVTQTLNVVGHSPQLLVPVNVPSRIAVMLNSVTTRFQYSRRWLGDFGLSANLADSTESLDQRVREGHPIKVSKFPSYAACDSFRWPFAELKFHYKNLAKRLDTLEKAVKTGTPQDAFQLGETVAFFTGHHPLAGMGQVRGASGRPRQVDFDLLSHVVSAYRVLDIYLATVDQSPDTTIRTQRPHDSEMDPEKATVVEGYLSITDWTALVADIPDLVREGVTEGSVQTVGGVSADLASLAKNWIRTGDTASISRMSSHLHLCAISLWCLCDPANNDVSSPLHRPIFSC